MGEEPRLSVDNDQHGVGAIDQRHRGILGVVREDRPARVTKLTSGEKNVTRVIAGALGQSDHKPDETSEGRRERQSCARKHTEGSYTNEGGSGGRVSLRCAHAPSRRRADRAAPHPRRPRRGEAQQARLRRRSGRLGALPRARRDRRQGRSRGHRCPERLRPGRPAGRLRAARAPPAAPARRSRSSTPTTTRTPRPTLATTARRTACRRAPRPTAASEGQPERRARALPARTAAGRWRSRSTSTWPRRSARTARSCSSRRARNAFANLGAAVNTAARLGRDVISNSYGGTEFSGEASATYDSHSTTPASRSRSPRATAATASSSRPRRST